MQGRSCEPAVAPGEQSACKNQQKIFQVLHYTLITDCEKTHDTVILQTYLENMTANQVQILVPDVDDAP